MSRDVGRVALVGAGPGDPDLLTVRAVRCLEEADVVLYDALCDARLLALCPRARKLYVGKRAGRLSFSQETISRLLVRYARRGQRVVRLKAGDPFVFGRGAEERDYVEHAGFEVTVVPGVTSAFAAPLSAGISVTHREVARAVLVTSAVPFAPFEEVIHGLAGTQTTVVVLMGLQKRHEIARAMVRAGYPDETPVAVVLGATTEREIVHRTALRNLAALDLTGTDLPGVIVVGDVARARAVVNSSGAPRMDVRGGVA